MKKGLFSLTNLSIKKKEEFDLVYKSGSKFSFSCYVVIFFPEKRHKIAVSISKRFGKAVYRNRRRRIIRETFRKNLADIPAGYYLFNLIKKPENENMEKEEILKIFECLKSLKKY